MMRAWLSGGAIPDCDDLEADLIGPEYGYAADQVSIQLESKKDMKSRGLPSPDDADALACTFADFVLPRALPPHIDPWSYEPPAVDPDIYAELTDE